VGDRYAKNAGVVFSLKHHIVWCPKYRRAVLTHPVDARLKALFTEIAAEHRMRLHAVEVMPDHVHLFVETDPTLCVAEIVNRFKGRTSRVAARVPVSAVAIANTLEPQRLRGHGWRRLGEHDQRLYRSAEGPLNAAVL
jgi:REP element-mobilizing transposase RayT